VRSWVENVIPKTKLMSNRQTIFHGARYRLYDILHYVVEQKISVFIYPPVRRETNRPQSACSPCILCGANNSALLWRATDHHYGNAGEWDVFQCSACGLGFLNPMPGEDELASYYPAFYPPHQKFTLPRRWRRIFNKMIFSDVSPKDPHFPAPGRLLDVGCGSGEFLLQAQARGWNVTGVETGHAPTAFARSLGLDVFRGTVLEACFSSAEFDYVRLNHTLEHLPNPVATLREIRRILKPEGKLFIGVPNCEGTMARFWGNCWWYLGAPVHTYQYSDRSLPRMLRQCGFEVERVRYNANYQGTLGSLQIFLNRIFLNRETNGIASRGSLPRSRFWMVAGNWLARLIQLFGTGDAIEAVARPAPGKSS
jgi:SAM-dependent methyltransferase